MTEYRVVLNHEQLDRTPLRQATLCIPTRIYGLRRLSDQIFKKKLARLRVSFGCVYYLRV